MTLLIVFLSILFVVLTIMVVNKAQTIVNGMKGPESENEYLGAPDKSNSANGIALLVVWVAMMIGMIWSFIAAKKHFLPVASIHGQETDYWFWVSMIVITIAFFLVNSIMFYFTWKYRYKKGREVAFYTHNNNLEVIWTSVPAVIMAGLVFTGLRVWNNVMAKAPDNAEQIEIMGKQFAWTVRYAGADEKFGRFSYKLMDDEGGNPLGVDFKDESTFDDFANTSEMHIPVNTPVKLNIRARDVLHSVFIPHMRVKMDAVPGMPTSFHFVANKTTAQMRTEVNNPKFNYEIACTEICGRSHFGMKLLLVVDSKEDYAKWKVEQKPMLTENAALLSKVPANLKAKAMKYIVQEAVVSSDSVVTATN